ncbi:MAG: photosynthetic reaction center subunit H [Pseudomonadota bacterium]
MVGVEFFGNVDLASVAIWGFWLFFAGLVYYLQTENMREGYPLEDEDGNPAANQGPFALPSDKTFHLRDGRGELTVPSGARGDRDSLALARTAASEGFPHAPTGDPLADGVGPAAWAPRKDEPELDAHGHAKIQPMSDQEGFFVSAGRDPRGLPVLSKDDQVIGHVSEMWIDPSEHEVRYLQYDLESEWGSGSRLVPLTFAKIKDKWVDVWTLNAKDFNGAPQLKGRDTITKLEEEKVAAYYGGGILYS